MSTQIAVGHHASQVPHAAGRVLVVDDHSSARESMCDILRAAHHQVDAASNAMEALSRLESESFDVVITDLRMPGMSGLDFIRELERRDSHVQVVMVTAYASVATAVEAMRHGAFDYIEKPFGADQLESLVARAMENGRMLDRQPTSPARHGLCPAMIGSSTVMQILLQRISQIAPTSETVLVTGESGTGKELVARAIHAASRRHAKAMVSLNCPVLSAQLMESELFGHERGAFTGADAPRTGRFELADGGTILLDEISEIDLGLQAKLLRVLQEKSFERVGSSRTTSVDARIIATTNRDLQAEVSAGRFREDLFFRLNVLPLRVPPLRERREDVPPLVQHFLLQSAARLRKDPCTLQADARNLLTEYHWPGNVRELENLMTRASVLNTGKPISADELWPWLLNSTQPMAAAGEVPTGLNMHDMERKLIETTLEQFGGHRAKTAEALGIGLRTLSRKLKQWGYAPRTRSFAKAS